MIETEPLGGDLDSDTGCAVRATSRTSAPPSSNTTVTLTRAQRTNADTDRPPTDTDEPPYLTRLAWVVPLVGDHPGPPPDLHQSPCCLVTAEGGGTR